MKWFSCNLKMPSEHEFCPGTMISRPVLATVVVGGKTYVRECHTINGDWQIGDAYDVLAWAEMPLPAAPEVIYGNL